MGRVEEERGDKEGGTGESMVDSQRPLPACQSAQSRLETFW